MSEIRIAIPDLDLNNALRLDGNLRNYEIGPFDDVVLDFSRMTNFDPLPMLMAGAIIKRFRYQYHDNTFSISGINGKSYAGTMGFFKYISESIVYDREYHIIFIIMRDITSEEVQAAQHADLCNRTAEITNEVIEKQMRVVQEIASLLGETTAETKIALTQLRDAIQK